MFFMETMLPQLQEMQKYFASRVTNTYEYRKHQLIKLKDALYQYEEEIYTAKTKTDKVCRKSILFISIVFLGL